MLTTFLPTAPWEAFMSSTVPCQLCQQPVPLEIARINELGKAVHEECYLQAIKMPDAKLPDFRKPSGSA